MSCVDVIVVKQADGSFKSTPFFVRFTNKANRPQLVRIYIDGQKFQAHMDHEKQFVLDRENQYAHFREWAFMKKHNQVSNLRIQHLKRFNSSKSSNTPHSPAFSTCEYVRKSRNYGSKSMYISSEQKAEYDAFRKQLDATLSPIDSPDNAVDDAELAEPTVTTLQGTASDPAQTSSADEVTRDDSTYYYAANTSSSNTPNTPASPSADDSPDAAKPKGFFDNWLTSIDNEAHPYEKLVPSSEYLKQLNLTKEITKISYEWNGERIEGRIFLWDYKDKLVVSDVDGTITKSDLMGQIFSRLGRDYTHAGIPSLFTKIVQRGYKLFYLTARPITDGQLTRKYIENVKQGDYKMPIAPVITTPNTTWSALAREVIIRKPETFKILILSFIKDLFAPSAFVAGWGNRPTDCLSYTTVGIDPNMSFRVNSRGEIVVHNSKTYFSSHQNFESKLDKLNLFPMFHQPSSTLSTILNKRRGSKVASEEHEALHNIHGQQKEDSLLDLHFSPIDLEEKKIDLSHSTSDKKAAEKEVASLVQSENRNNL
jgi:phosphatidate phosphatase PAH1